MKIRYLILFTTLVFLGFSVTAAAHRCNAPDPNHKHCNLEPSDDPSAWYDVTITGPDGGGLSGDFWGAGEYWKASTNRQVNYKHFDPPPSTGLLDLTFFRTYFNGIDAGRGNNCFPLVGQPPSAVVQIHSVILNCKKSTGARALIWFHGKTYQDDTEVLYQLRLNGTLDVTNWPPEGTPNLMVMATWNMVLANEGNETQNISCLAEDVSIAATPVEILVEPVPPPPEG